jgi:dipeptidyl aminopeptidase/acylaminoacyl peptidase
MKERRSKMISDSESTVEDRHATFLRSPDGRLQVVFGRKEKGVERLYVASIEGGAVLPLPLPPLMSASISATNDGTIFFAGGETAPNGQHLGAPDLYRWQDGTLTQLTKTPWEEWRPTPDPSGRYLFHIANQDGQFDIVRLDVSTKETTRFFGTDADEWDPDVSPDGRWVVFASKASGNWDLMVVSTEAPDKPDKLIDGNADDWDPRFTPDGRAVLFASSNAGAPPFMYFVCPFGEFTP